MKIRGFFKISLNAEYFCCSLKVQNGLLFPTKISKKLSETYLVKQTEHHQNSPNILRARTKLKNHCTKMKKSFMEYLIFCAVNFVKGTPRLLLISTASLPFFINKYYKLNIRNSKCINKTTSTEKCYLNYHVQWIFSFVNSRLHQRRLDMIRKT